MTFSFGIFARPLSLAWDDVRRGPPVKAVREHLYRLVNFGQNEETTHESADR